MRYIGDQMLRVWRCVRETPGATRYGVAKILPGGHRERSNYQAIARACSAGLVIATDAGARGLLLLAKPPEAMDRATLAMLAAAHARNGIAYPEDLARMLRRMNAPGAPPASQARRTA